MYKYDVDKMYSYIKGYSMALGYDNTVKALAFARKCHSGQMRKGGEPYIVHPLTMASHAITLKIANDELLAAILLHDVVEDCNVSVHELPVSNEVKTIVWLVTYDKPENKQDKIATQTYYYKEIGENREASLVKLIDRCHNVSTMAGTFTPAKITEYIEETERFILPLIRNTKDKWPEISDALFIIKYHIHSVIDSLKVINEIKEELKNE